jgi:frataxin-like iron-binding protein CyaY
VITIAIQCPHCKHFDIIDGRWRYSHIGEALHDLLAREFNEHLEQLGTEIDLSGLPHSLIQPGGDN